MCLSFVLAQAEKEKDGSERQTRTPENPAGQ